MDEFGLIEKYLAPLAMGHKGALSLLDDAAIISSRKDYELIITKDAIAEGVHFLPGTSPELIAKKLLRTNLSDIAAMGGVPKYYLIAAMLTGDIDEKWIGKFSKSLGEEQKIFGIHLIGGDTIKHSGPLSFSLTMMGEVKKGAALKRSGAKPGDGVYVSGTIGDGALGLKILRGEIKAGKAGEKYLAGRYHIPQPRLDLGRKLVGIASACMDISDGLVADLGHICIASKVSAIIEKEKIPLSPAAKAILKTVPKFWDSIFSGGDDYELLFTVPVAKEKELQALAPKLGIAITRIGNIVKKTREKIVVLEKHQPLRLKNKGYSHF